MASPSIAAAERALEIARATDAIATYDSALADCDRVERLTEHRLAYGQITEEVAAIARTSNANRRAALADARAHAARRLADA